MKIINYIQERLKMKIKTLVLSFLIITLFVSCDSPASPKTSIAEIDKPDIWCTLNFKLKIKIIDDNEFGRFDASVHSLYQIQTLERMIEVNYPEGTEREWNHIDDFKTGDKEYIFELCYLAHTSPYTNLPGLSICGLDAYNIKLQIIPIASNVIVSQEFFSTDWSCGLGHRKKFKFKLNRQ